MNEIKIVTENDIGNGLKIDADKLHINVDNATITLNEKGEIQAEQSTALEFEEIVNFDDSYFYGSGESSPGISIHSLAFSVRPGVTASPGIFEVRGNFQAKKAFRLKGTNLVLLEYNVDEMLLQQKRLLVRNMVRTLKLTLEPTGDMKTLYEQAKNGDESVTATFNVKVALPDDNDWGGKIKTLDIDGLTQQKALDEFTSLTVAGVAYPIENGQITIPLIVSGENATVINTSEWEPARIEFSRNYPEYEIVPEDKGYVSVYANVTFNVSEA